MVSPALPSATFLKRAGKTATWSIALQPGQGAGSLWLKMNSGTAVPHSVQEMDWALIAGLFFDHTRVRHVVMDGSLFPVEDRYNVTQIANRLTQNLRAGSSQGLGGTERGASARDHFQPASHLPGSRAVFGQKKPIVEYDHN